METTIQQVARVLGYDIYKIVSEEYGVSYILLDEKRNVYRFNTYADAVAFIG